MTTVIDENTVGAVSRRDTNLDKTTYGRVYLIGAGPGDPGLITVRGRDLLRAADAVVYDYLANPVLLRECRADAERIYVGKMAGNHALTQDEINALLVRLAHEGKNVARLKGGDPFVFGRGGEEAEELIKADVRFEVVPGISSSIAAPAYAGIPVTHRSAVSSFTVITGHEDPNRPADESRINWQGLADGGGTLVFLMGVGNLPEISSKLIQSGKSPETPVAIVRWGTTWQQKVVEGTLATIAERAKAAGIKPPAVTVVGEVAALRGKLAWFDTPDVRPLLGRRVVVTRAREQASDVVRHLTELGAEAIEFPVIRMVPPTDNYAGMDAAIKNLSSYNWIVFTSVNGVDYFWQRLMLAGKDARNLGSVKICAIGPATAAGLKDRGIVADLVPLRFVAEGILATFAGQYGDLNKTLPLDGQHMLLPRADIARDALVEGLAKMGAAVDQVNAYSTISADIEGEEAAAAELVERLDAGEVDVVTFTSSSTVRNFADRILKAAPGRELAALLEKTTIACIGPITADTARSYGLPIHIEAAEFTVPALVDAIVAHYRDGIVNEATR